MKINPQKKFNKMLQPPPDKSIMQRAVIIGGLFGRGITIENPSFCGDALSAIDCITALGAEVDYVKGTLVITPVRQAVIKPRLVINAGNSATAMRLLTGALAGLDIEAVITGDESLNRRSMKDTILALEEMGARIESKSYYPPLKVCKTEGLNGIDFKPVKPSAQVKSAVLLAGINAKGGTFVYEEVQTRNHTEKMLEYFGIESALRDSSALPVGLLRKTIRVPGDISSAAYPVVRALLTDGGFAYIKNTGINSLRTGFIEVLKNAGASILVEKTAVYGLEDVGNITVRGGAELKPVNIDGNKLPRLIDEIPILAVAACFCKGVSVFSGLAPLRNKESDRVKEVYLMLKAFGAAVFIKGDSLEIEGMSIGRAGKNLPVIESSDHRIVMSAAVLGKLTGGCIIKNPSAAAVSYPDFFEDME